jgi:hypothetical protein
MNRLVGISLRETGYLEKGSTSLQEFLLERGLQFGIHFTLVVGSESR